MHRHLRAGCLTLRIRTPSWAPTPVNASNERTDVGLGQADSVGRSMESRAGDRSVKPEARYVKEVRRVDVKLVALPVGEELRGCFADSDRGHGRHVHEVFDVRRDRAVQALHTGRVSDERAETRAQAR